MIKVLINQPRQDQSSMISDKLFFGCRVWITVFFGFQFQLTPIGKKIRPDSGRGIPTIQAPMEGGEPTPPEEGSSNGAGVRQTQWKQSDLDPNSTDVFCGGNPWKTQRLEPERIIPIWKATSSELNRNHDFGFILFPLSPIQNHGWVEKWRDVCFQPTGSMGLVYLPTLIP